MIGVDLRAILPTTLKGGGMRNKKNLKKALVKPKEAIHELTAKRIKELRELFCLTQEEMGEIMEVSASAISHYEAGKRDPRISAIMRLVKYARSRGVLRSVEYFFEE
jgi:DNA-binding XRE family transcriptional regulator